MATKGTENNIKSFFVISSMAAKELKAIQISFIIRSTKAAKELKTI